MRVVLLGTEFNMTGAGLLLFRWAAHLRRRGHEIIAVHDANMTGPLRESYLAEGMDAVVEKPIKAEVLLAVMNRLLARAAERVAA